MPGSKNMIVAFGHNDKQFFIAASRSTESHRLPTSMHNQIVGELRTPIEFASWGPGEPGHVKYFLSGYAPANANTRRSRWHIGDNPVATALHDACKSGGRHYPKGVSFGKNGAYAWWSDSGCHYGKLGDLRLSWVKKMKLEYPGKRITKLFLGSGSGAVVVWDDQTFAYQGLNHRLATVLTDARKKGLHPRHVAMGLFNSEWFFVQFSDMSITWYAPKELSDHLKDHAKALGVQRYVHTS